MEPTLFSFIIINASKNHIIVSHNYGLFSNKYVQEYFVVDGKFSVGYTIAEDIKLSGSLIKLSIVYKMMAL